MIISAGVENLTSWERKLLYMCNARPTINTRALFSDASSYLIVIAYNLSSLYLEIII